MSPPIRSVPRLKAYNVKEGTLPRAYLMVRFSVTPGCRFNTAHSSSNEMRPLPSSSASSNKVKVKLSRTSSLICMLLSLTQCWRTVFSSVTSMEPLPGEWKREIRQDYDFTARNEPVHDRVFATLLTHGRSHRRLQVLLTSSYMYMYM